MHTRMAVVLSAMTLFGLGCHGSNYSPPPTAARSMTPPPLPQETVSVSGSRVTPGENRAASTTATTATTNNAASVPPPSAGTSTPTQGTDPFKPGNQPPSSVGGGPKAETGGAVFGDGNRGNAGAVKGGDGSSPGK